MSCSTCRLVVSLDFLLRVSVWDKALQLGFLAKDIQSWLQPLYLKVEHNAFLIYRVSQKMPNCWNHGAQAKWPVAGTSCVWKNDFWSFLTKTKQDQALPSHVHWEIWGPIKPYIFLNPIEWNQIILAIWTEWTRPDSIPRPTIKSI